MSRSRGRRWALAVLAALVAAAAAQLLVHHDSTPDTPTSSRPGRQAPPGDLVRHAAAEVARTHFYVAPELADRLTAAQRRAVEQALTAHPGRPERFLLWSPDTSTAGFYIAPDGLRQVEALVGRPGIYALVDEKMLPTENSVEVGSSLSDPALLEQRPGPGLLAYASDLGADLSSPGRASQAAHVSPAFGGLVVGLVAFGALALVVAALTRARDLVAGTSRGRRRDGSGTR